MPQKRTKPIEVIPIDRVAPENGPRPWSPVREYRGYKEKMPKDLYYMSFDEALSRLDKFRRDSPPTDSEPINLDFRCSKSFQKLEAMLNTAFDSNYILHLSRFTTASPDASLPHPQPATSSWHLYAYKPCDPPPTHKDPFPSDTDPLVLPGPLGDPDTAPRTKGLRTEPRTAPHERASGLRPAPGVDVRYRIVATPTDPALRDTLPSAPPPGYFDEVYNSIAHVDPANSPKSVFDIDTARPVPRVAAEALSVYAELFAGEDGEAMQRVWPHVAAYEIWGREERAVVGPRGAVRGDEAFVSVTEWKQREHRRKIGSGIEIGGEWSKDVEGAVVSLLGRLWRVGEVIEERRTAATATAAAANGSNGKVLGEDWELVDGDVGPSEDFLVEIGL